MRYITLPTVVTSSLLVMILLCATPAVAQSDSGAVEIARESMQAVGGDNGWETTRFVQWSIFGQDHLWDKYTGDFRHERDSLKVLMNILTQEGEATMGGVPLEGDELKDVLKSSYASWVNNGYWVFMPFKLTDPGVTLKKVVDSPTAAGEDAYVLQMTFEDTGLTPQNMYHVWIAKESMQVKQWAFYPTADAADPMFSLPWDGYEQFGDIWLASNRGEGSRGPIKVSNLAVYQTMTDDQFENRPLAN